MFCSNDLARNRSAGRGRNRAGLTLPQRLEREAIAAARRNDSPLAVLAQDGDLPLYVVPLVDDQPLVISE